MRKKLRDVCGDDFLEKRVSARLFVDRNEARNGRRKLDSNEPFLFEQMFQVRLRESTVRLDIKTEIDAQIRNEERFAKSDERFAKSDERFAKSDERFARFEARTDQTLTALMEIVEKLPNGHS